MTTPLHHMIEELKGTLTQREIDDALSLITKYKVNQIKLAFRSLPRCTNCDKMLVQKYAEHGICHNCIYMSKIRPIEGYDDPDEPQGEIDE